MHVITPLQLLLHYFLYFWVLGNMPGLYSREKVCISVYFLRIYFFSSPEYPSRKKNRCNDEFGPKKDALLL
jgi:hypothetical protein